MGKCNRVSPGLWQKICRSFLPAWQKDSAFPKLLSARSAFVAVVLTVAACGGGGGGGNEGAGGGTTPASSNFVVSGTVSAPNNAVAFLPRKNLLEQFADAFIAPVHAAISGFLPVADGSQVQLVRINNDGTIASVLDTTTTTGGRYSFNLTALGLGTASDLIIQVLDSSGVAKMRAFVAAARVDVDPVAETAVRIVLERAATSSLNNFTTQELADIYSALYLFVMTQSLTSGANIESTVSAFKSAVLADTNIAAFIASTADANQTTQGPGDIGNYFPFGEGTTWVYQGTEESGGQTTNYINTIQINGTHATSNSVTTTIFRETNPANSGVTEEDYLVKDGQAITNYGTNDVTDFLTPQIAPYREYIFPLGTNSSFVAINKSGLTWPDYLGDGDGKPELATVNAIVTVVGFETAKVKSGTYINVAKIVSEIIISVVLSADNTTATETITSTEWYAPGVGLVKSITVLQTNIDNVVTDISITTEELSTFSKPLVLASIAVGNGHTCGLTTLGKAYCWGDNSNGQVGDGTLYTCTSVFPDPPCPPPFPTSTISTIPSPVSGGLVFKSLDAGGYMSCGLISTGVAYCWGGNTYGELGNGSTTRSGIPVAVSGGITFSSLSTGTSNTCGVATNGMGYCWGQNTYGQVGDGSSINRATPTLVTGGITFQSISAAVGSHTCGLTSNGAAYCWGNNSMGQLGNGTQNSSLVPVPVLGGLAFASLKIGTTRTCGITTNGNTYCWGQIISNGMFVPVTSPTMELYGLPFNPISSGHVCELFSGSAYCWGTNTFGQLGNGTTSVFVYSPAPVLGGLTFASIDAGGSHSCGITMDGAGYCWGYNFNGQLGIGTSAYSSDSSRSMPAPISPPK